MMMGVESVLPDSVVSARVVGHKFARANAEHDRSLVGLRYWGSVQRRRSAWDYGMVSGLGGLGGLGGGLGDTASDLTTVDASGNIIDMNGNVLGNVDTTPVYTTTLPSGQTVAAPSEAALIAAVTAAGLDLAKLAIIQPGTAQAGGSIIRQNPGFSVQPIATNNQTGLTANLSTGAGVAFGTVAMIGLGLVALIAVTGGRRH